MKLTVISLFLVTVLFHETHSCNKKSTRDSGTSTDDKQVTASSLACCICGLPIDITLIVRNQYQPPFFEHTIDIQDKPQRELIHHLEEASIMDPKFRFSADHFGSLGYMVTKIGGLAASTEDKTYWELIDHFTGMSLKLGVNSHVPMHGDTILFNFTTWATTEHQVCQNETWGTPTVFIDPPTD